MTKTTFTTSPRKLTGKKVKQLRREAIVPGNVYGGKGESFSLQFSEKEFNKLYGEVGDTGLVYLNIEGEKQEKPTLIDEVQVDPVTSQTLHVSFKEVDLKEKIEAEVQIELIGEFDIKEAVLVQVKNSIVVESLPTDLPEKFEVNIGDLTEVGQSITLADLKFDKSKVTLVEVENEEDWENPIVLIQEQREEEVEEVAEVVEEDGEEDVEGEEGKEGEQEEVKDSGGEETQKEAKKKD